MDKPCEACDGWGACDDCEGTGYDNHGDPCVVCGGYELMAIAGAVLAARMGRMGRVRRNRSRRP